MSSVPLGRDLPTAIVDQPFRLKPSSRDSLMLKAQSIGAGVRRGSNGRHTLLQNPDMAQ